MPRKSKVTRLPAEQRRFVEKLLRDDSLTLSEIIERVRQQFPTADVSRSGLGRYKQQVDELAGRMRDIQAAGTALVSELGEDPNDRGGQLLVQAVTTLATHAALKANGASKDDELSIKEIAQLARGARAVLEARKMSLAERQQIAKDAREALQREQAEQLAAVTKAGGLSAKAAATIRREILGIPG